MPATPRSASERLIWAPPFSMVSRVTAVIEAGESKALSRLRWVETTTGSSCTGCGAPWARTGRAAANAHEAKAAANAKRSDGARVERDMSYSSGNFVVLRRLRCLQATGVRRQSSECGSVAVWRVVSSETAGRCTRDADALPSNDSASSRAVSRN